ncbi:MAG: hypothetical protein LBK56_00400 [Gracilibacteraceae bacterium]|jgi:mannose-6-phosphate isomerase-like protein (cupin superfamily)|nr:hypothetical protein [Gracilibacteraceae bacterium]
MYTIIDANNSLNLKTKEYEPETRTRLAPGFDGDQLDKGHCVQWMWNTDKLGLIRVEQAAGMGTSPREGFVFHDNRVEIEYLLDSVCDLSYPDGTHIEFLPGDCLCHAVGQPHRMETVAPRHMEIAVFLNGSLDGCSRTHFDPRRHKETGWQVKRCAELPGAEWNDPLVDVKIVYEEDGISFAEFILQPGAQIPPRDFARNNNADEIVLVRSGRGLAIYPDQSYPLYADVTAYNEAGQLYKYVNTGTENLVLLCCFSAGSLKEIGYQEVKLNS